jgi:hypothetical protein
MALWRHLSLQRVTARLYILGGLVMWAFLLILRIISSSYRNLHWGRPLPQATVYGLKGAVRIDVTVPRGTVGPGQFVDLWFPTFIFQLNAPIIEWHKTPEGLTLQLLLSSRSKLAKRLAPSDGESCARHRALVIGLHGMAQSFEDYGTIIIFASGIRINQVLSHMMSLLDAMSDSRSRWRYMKVLWGTGGGSEYAWVSPWMDKLIVKDLYFVSCKHRLAMTAD